MAGEVDLVRSNPHREHMVFGGAGKGVPDRIVGIVVVQRPTVWRS